MFDGSEIGEIIALILVIIFAPLGVLATPLLFVKVQRFRGKREQGKEQGHGQEEQSRRRQNVVEGSRKRDLVQRQEVQREQVDIETNHEELMEAQQDSLPAPDDVLRDLGLLGDE